MMRPERFFNITCRGKIWSGVMTPGMWQTHVFDQNMNRWSWSGENSHLGGGLGAEEDTSKVHSDNGVEVTVLHAEHESVLLQLCTVLFSEFFLVYEPCSWFVCGKLISIVRLFVQDGTARKSLPQVLLHSFGLCAYSVSCGFMRVRLARSWWEKRL